MMSSYEAAAPANMVTSCDKQHAPMYKITSNLIKIDVKQHGVGRKTVISQEPADDD